MLHSVFSSSVPPVAPFNDGTPRIVLGNYFYLANAFTTWHSTGARVQIPNDAAFFNQDIKISIWVRNLTGMGAFDLFSITPTASKTVSTGASAGWLEVTWDSPILVNNYSQQVAFIGYEFIETAGLYIAAAPPLSAGGYQAQDGSSLYLAESPFTLSGNTSQRAVYQMNTGPQTSNAWYGVDIIVDDAGAAPNVIQAENALSGNSSTEWSIGGAGDTTNLGFVRKFSSDAGETVQFSCHGTGTVLDVYRIGYYGGMGWRKITTLTNTATSQPNPNTIPNSNGGVECSNWSITTSWVIPSDAVSGLYVGVLRNVALNNASYIPFIVRNDDRAAEITYKTSDTTWALAYNYYGTPAAPLTGKSLYGSGGPLGDITTRCHAVSYHRPIITRQGVPQTYWLACEAPMIRWMERHGFDVKYIASIDLHEDATRVTADSVLISCGHDEYWSKPMRDNTITHRNNGGHILFMSGNEAFWKTRFTDSNTMWCYKDTMTGPGAHVAGTPLDPIEWTGTWKDTRWTGNDPENMLTGTDFRMNGILDFAATISSATYGSHPFWRDTTVTTTNLTTGTGFIGFEADSYKPTQPPPSIVRLAATTINIDGSYANDNGEIYTGNGNLNWGIVSQRYSSGAVVVGFGTCQFSWGLDQVHDRGGDIRSTALQQAMLNLLSDLGAPPYSIVSGFVQPVAVSLDSYGLVPTANTLLGQWGFDNNLNDSSGNGRHGTFEDGGSGLGITYINGPHANTKAVQFLHANQSINYGRTGLEPDADGITIMGWVKVDNGDVSPALNLLSKAKANTSSRIRIGVNLADGITRKVVYVARWKDDLLFSIPNTTFNNGWHHIALVDGNNKREIYLDGILLESGTRSFNNTTNPTWEDYPWRTGRDAVVADQYAGPNFATTQLRIFKGELTQAEINTFKNTPILASTTSRVKVWNGTAWVSQVKAWNGTAWVPVKSWNGSTWG